LGVSNPLETVIGILSLIDDVRAKMEGTKLAEIPWRPVSSASAADVLAGLTHEALARCDDVTEAVIVVTVAAMTAASREIR
jgi:hypothetical protein